MCEGRDADQVVEDSAAVGIVGAVVVGLHRIEHLACLLEGGGNSLRGKDKGGWTGPYAVVRLVALDVGVILYRNWSIKFPARTASEMLHNTTCTCVHH